MHHLSVTTTCAAPESFARVGPTLTTFFSLMGEELSKYHYKRAIFSQPAKRHLNGVLLACRLWPIMRDQEFFFQRGSRPDGQKNSLDNVVFFVSIFFFISPQLILQFTEGV